MPSFRILVGLLSLLHVFGASIATDADRAIAPQPQHAMVASIPSVA